MAKFEDAIEHVLKNEGGFSNHPDDPGGSTNFGVSLRFYKTIKPDATEDDIKTLTVDMAKQIYREEFWARNKYNLIVDQSIACLLFDICVNIGAQNANACMQRSIRAACGFKVKEDGIVGRETLFYINHCKPESLIPAFKADVAAYYRALVRSNPALSNFLNGWLNRIYGHPKANI